MISFFRRFSTPHDSRSIYLISTLTLEFAMQSSIPDSRWLTSCDNAYEGQSLANASSFEGLFPSPLFDQWLHTNGHDEFGDISPMDSFKSPSFQIGSGMRPVLETEINRETGSEYLLSDSNVLLPAPSSSPIWGTGPCSADQTVSISSTSLYFTSYCRNFSGQSELETFSLCHFITAGLKVMQMI